MSWTIDLWMYNAENAHSHGRCAILMNIMFEDVLRAGARVRIASASSVSSILGYLDIGHGGPSTGNTPVISASSPSQHTAGVFNQ